VAPPTLHGVGVGRPNAEMLGKHTVASMMCGDTVL